MEEKPEGTPNPLSPKLEVGPIVEPSVPNMEEARSESESKPETESDAATRIEIKVKSDEAEAQPKVAESPKIAESPKVTENPKIAESPKADSGVKTAELKPTTPQPLTTLGVVTNMDGSVAEKIDPLNRPMQQVPTADAIAVEQKKKKRKHKALIAGVVISLFIAIGCGVMATLLVINMNKVDPVAEATSKLMSPDAPANIMLDGEIRVNFKDANAPISNLKVSIDTEAVVKTMINSSVMSLQANLRDNSNFEASISEIYAAKGDLYIKIDNLSEFLSGLSGNNGAEINTEGSLVSSFDTLGLVEGEWMRIPLNNINTVLPSELTDNSGFACATALISDNLNNYNTIAELYNKYPFIVSTDKDLTVTSERDPIYRVMINDNFEKFVTEAQNTWALKSLSSCLGYKSNAAGTSNLMKTVQELPEIFVEVNDRYNFTRLYFTFEDNGADTAVDLRFSYPTNVNVPEPLEYKDFSVQQQAS